VHCDRLLHTLGPTKQMAAKLSGGLHIELKTIMRRRDLILIFAGAAASCPLMARSQEPEAPRMARGLLHPAKYPAGTPCATAVRSELEKAGWTVGVNLQVDFEWGTGDADWVRSTTERALRKTPDVLLANGDPAILAAHQLTRSVPIIFIGNSDPVGDGLVQ